MKHFVLYVEGQTEFLALPRFFKSWLDAPLTQPVGISPVYFKGAPELWKEAPGRATKLLNSPRSTAEIIGIIALLDLKSDLPFPNNCTTAAKKLAWGKAEIERAVNDARFKHFFIQHELEAWLLADLKSLPRELRKKTAELMRGRKPEAINMNAPPSYLLNDAFQSAMREHYRKTRHGVTAFSNADVNIVYDTCPSLKAILDEMLSMAHAAGL